MDPEWLNQDNAFFSSVQYSFYQYYSMTSANLKSKSYSKTQWYQGWWLEWTDIAFEGEGQPW